MGSGLSLLSHKCNNFVTFMIDFSNWLCYKVCNMALYINMLKNGKKAAKKRGYFLKILQDCTKFDRKIRERHETKI